MLELGIREQGDPPCPWSWLALGSEARQEQALLTDQDNALVIEPGDEPLEAVDPYFEQLAGFVNLQLERSGIPRCKAGVIAANAEWRHTPAQWEERFRRWMGEGTWVGGAMVAISFDYRAVAGPLEIEPVFDRLIRGASAQGKFIKRIGTTALEARPPTGFVRDSVIHRGAGAAEALDIKQGGIDLLLPLEAPDEVLHYRRRLRWLLDRKDKLLLVSVEAKPEEGAARVLRLDDRRQPMTDVGIAPQRKRGPIWLLFRRDHGCRPDLLDLQ